MIPCSGTGNDFVDVTANSGNDGVAPGLTTNMLRYSYCEKLLVLDKVLEKQHNL
jgi:hypothetical protein